MKPESYHFDVAQNALNFEFDSVGPKGRVRKVIAFQKTEIPGVFSLSFGNALGDGEIDVLTVTDNNDRNRILATVIKAIHHFFEKHPNAGIVFTGSTNARTRLYRATIARYTYQVEHDILIYGFKNGTLEPFQKGGIYDGFLIKRR